MSRRRTAIFVLFCTEPEKAVQELREAVQRSGGNLARCAHDLMCSRRQLYRWLDRANLWGEVQKQRAEARNPEWLRRTAEALEVEDDDR